MCVLVIPSFESVCVQYACLAMRQGQGLGHPQDKHIADQAGWAVTIRVKEDYCVESQQHHREMTCLLDWQVQAGLSGSLTGPGGLLLATSGGSVVTSSSGNAAQSTAG